MPTRGLYKMQLLERLFGDWKTLAIYPISLFGLDFMHLEMAAKVILWLLAIAAGILNVILLWRKLKK